MGSDFLELELYLEEDGEYALLEVHTKEGDRFVIPRVVGNPVRSYGVWSVACEVGGRLSTALIPAESVRYFTATRLEELNNAGANRGDSGGTREYSRRSNREFLDPEMELVTLENSNTELYVHPNAQCCGQVCSIHNRTPHLSRDFPQSWRPDRGIMERICEHGVGHPDPDDYRIYTGEDDGRHGCDGCCGPNDGAHKLEDLSGELI